MKAKRKFVRNTPAEDAAINAAIVADPDTYEVKNFSKLSPFKRGRPPIEKPKVQVTLRLDPEVLEHFRGLGRGWQTRLNEALVGWVARRKTVK